MKNAILILAISLALVFSCFAQRRGGTPAIPQSSNQGPSQAVNRIEGTIRDESGGPVYNAYVELYNETGVLLAHQRSSSQGRFSFRGVGQGRFTVVVRPYGTNLKEDSQEVNLSNQLDLVGDYANADFRLQRDKRFDNNAVQIVGTIFAQDVPDDAKRLYKAAISDLDDHKDEKALGELEEAIKLFPTYFDALTALGKKYILSGSYEKGYPFLLRAIDINQKCPDCYYSLGLAFYKLSQIPAGVQAAQAAVLLQPQLPENHLLLGMLFRLNGDLPQAEKALLTAKSLFKKPNAELYWQLSLLYNKMNRNSEAAEALEEYLKANPDADDSEKQRVKSLIAKLKTAK